MMDLSVECVLHKSVEWIYEMQINYSMIWNIHCLLFDEKEKNSRMSLVVRLTLSFVRCEVDIGHNSSVD